MKLYPEGALIPNLLQTDEFTILPLGPKDNLLDYDAVMASLSYYRKFHPADWSSINFSVEENLAELNRHEKDHNNRTAFTFSVQSPQLDSALGCIYVNGYRELLSWLKRPAEELAQAKAYECQVYFWTRPNCFETDLDRKILEAFSSWFETKWAFSKVLYQTYESDLRQTKIIVDSGLTQIGSHSLPREDGKLLIFVRS
jgi:hypothetical protein